MTLSARSKLDPYEAFRAGKRVSPVAKGEANVAYHRVTNSDLFAVTGWM